MSIANLTHAELLSHAQVDFDPLTGTALEAELLKRFSALIDRNDDLEEAASDLDNVAGLDLTRAEDRELVTRLVNLQHEFEHWDIRALLELLSERDLDNPDALRTVLERDAAMTGLLDDLADPIAKLHQLANPETTTQGAN